MKKKLLVPVVALVAVCLAFLTACGGPSAEDLIREDLTTQFEQVKSGDDELMESIESSAGEDFETLGIDASEFASSYLEGFDYSIDDITVDDATAVATVTVKCKSFADIIGDFQTQLYDALDTLDPATATEDDLYKLAGELLMDATNNAEVKETECEFTYERDDEGTWSATEDASTELTNALLG